MTTAPDTARVRTAPGAGGTTAGARASGLARAGLLLPAVVTVLLLVVVPLALVARDSLATADRYGRVEGGLTLENYRALFDGVYLTTISYSLATALANTALCLAAGYVVAWYIASRPPQQQPVLLMLVVIPFWTDFLVRTFAWINLLGPGGPLSDGAALLGVDLPLLIPSRGAVLLGLLYAFLPTAILPIYASLRSVDPALPEAARDLGCGWWGVHRRVLLPLAAPGLLAAVLLVFAPTLGVFVISVLLGGGKDPLLGNLIVTLYTEFRNQPMGAAASMVLLGAMVLIGLAVALLRRRTRTGAVPEPAPERLPEPVPAERAVRS